MSKVDWDLIRQEWETTKVTFKALAEKYGLSDSTVRSRKSREKWQRNEKSNATKNVKNVATKKKQQRKKATSNKKIKRSGNPNPKNQFTKRNTAARKHGLYSKYFTEAQQEIMDDFRDMDILDQLWLQIEIKFSAIIHLQRVMWVDYNDSHLKEESGYSSGEAGSSVSYKVAFAYEQFESYIKAQTRAMAEYRNMVKQFLSLAHEQDERVLKLKQMQANLDKTEKETTFLEERTKLIKGSKKDTSLLEALIDVVKKDE